MNMSLIICARMDWIDVAFRELRDAAGWARLERNVFEDGDGDQVRHVRLSYDNLQGQAPKKVYLVEGYWKGFTSSAHEGVFMETLRVQQLRGTQVIMVGERGVLRPTKV